MIQEKQISWLGVERAHRQVKSLKCQIVTRLVGFKGFLMGFYTSLEKTTSRKFNSSPLKVGRKAPKEKDRLPIPSFFRDYVKFWGCITPLIA